jgi:hypothetical protein
MGKHIPLPSDPIAKAAEKKRRFKVYQKAWKTKRAQIRCEMGAAAYRQRRSVLQSARQANIDLCLDLNDLTIRQLNAAIQTARRWISE